MCSNNDIGNYACNIHAVQVMCATPVGDSVGLPIQIIRFPLSPSPASVNAPTEMRYSVSGVSWVKVKLVWLGYRVVTSELLE